MEKYTKELVFSAKPAMGELMRAMQDVAGEHAAALGAGREELLKANAAWVIVQLRCEITRMPEKGERVFISTWPIKSRFRLYPRRYEFTAESGEVLLTALGIWAVMDLESRTTVDASGVGLLVDEAASDERVRLQRRISMPEGGEEYCFSPTEEHLDYNGHMNNARYLDVAESFLPKELREAKLLEMAVDFEHELLFGQKVSIRLVREGDSCTFEGRVEDSVCFRISERFAV